MSLSRISVAGAHAQPSARQICPIARNIPVNLGEIGARLFLLLGNVKRSWAGQGIDPHAEETETGPAISRGPVGH